LFHLRQQLLPDNVLAELRLAKTVVIVPQHILHYVPFSALVVTEDARKLGPHDMAVPAMLIDEPFQFCYAPSLQTWSSLRSGPAPLAMASGAGIVEFAAAPSLTGVKKDIDYLKSAFSNRPRNVLFGDDATEFRVKKLFEQPGLLLLATHGMNHADRPLDSFLLLHPHSGTSPGEVEDGRLTAAEVFSSSLNAELVVMSACYSGLADRSPMPGDDLFGLQRAFLTAGARTVVSGLWDVYDGSGPELMRGMFQRLAAGQPVACALADSQREFLKRLRSSPSADPWLHPYFWAVYTVNGSDLTGANE
jgi:CHAT domain-containing protein